MSARRLLYSCPETASCQIEGVTPRATPLRPPGLAAHATPPEAGADRRHEEIARSARPDFKRDRDRLFHSHAFLQLDRKSELFLAPDGGATPSRLLYATRTASTARALAEILRLNEDVAEAAVLARALGLPPFGRAGSEALRAAMAAHGGFDPAAQSLRIVDALEAKYPEFNGLNLSRPVRDSLRPPGGSPALESGVAAWAVRVTTLCLDLEGGLEARFLTEEALGETALWREVAEPVDRDYARLEAARRRGYILRNLLSLLVDRIAAHSVATSMPAGTPAIGLDEKTAAALGGLEALVTRAVRHAAPLEDLYRERAACVAELFAIYVHRPHLLGEAHLVRMKKEGVHRAAADFLAHCGDGELLRLRREIVGERRREPEQPMLL
jgi:dGTPase